MCMSRFALDFVAIEQMWHTHADKLRNGTHKTTQPQCQAPSQEFFHTEMTTRRRSLIVDCVNCLFRHKVNQRNQPKQNELTRIIPISETN